MKRNLHYIWVFNDPKEFTGIISDTNTSLIKRKGLLFIYYFCTSKIIFINDFTSVYLPARKKQLIINTWHGGGIYKTVGMTAKNPTAYDSFFFKTQRKMITHFISSSEYFTKSVLQDSFLFNGKVLEFGMPRNAVLFQDPVPFRNKIIQYFGIENNPLIILYAPTFRGSTKQGMFLNESMKLDFARCLHAFTTRFNRPVCMIFRAHHSMQYRIDSESVFDGTSYPDVQELLMAADILISDYSSLMWDFSLMKKPVFVYAPDSDWYINDRNFFWNIETWPHVITYSNDQMEKGIKNFCPEEYMTNIEHFLRTVGSYENEKSIEHIVDWINMQMA